jgi:hypothetical protein
VAIGSTLAMVRLSSSAALADGSLGLVCLRGVQYLVAWASIQSRAERLVT